MNGRWFDGRKLEAEFFDGKTDYRYKQTEEEVAERRKNWEKWLESEEQEEEDAGP